METEKVYQEKTARTIQQKQDGSGTLQFVDNRPMNPVLQRVGEDEEDALQGKFEQPLQREEDDEAMQGKFEEPVQKKNETGMPDNLKAGIEDLSGFAMDDVRVHYNSDKPATVQALAYTQVRTFMWLRDRNNTCPMRHGMWPSRWPVVWNLRPKWEDCR